MSPSQFALLCPLVCILYKILLGFNNVRIYWDFDTILEPPVAITCFPYLHILFQATKLQIFTCVLTFCSFWNVAAYEEVVLGALL
jgi:hypothetical protein